MDMAIEEIENSLCKNPVFFCGVNLLSCLSNLKFKKLNPFIFLMETEFRPASP